MTNEIKGGTLVNLESRHDLMNVKTISSKQKKTCVATKQDSLN